MTHAIQHIPLSKLIPSPANVRKTGRKDGVKQLAASIAAHGLLQNLTVQRSGNGQIFEVVAGARRLAALQALAKKRQLAKNAPIPCKLIKADDSATELSLAENAGQAPMHPADQYEAFAELHHNEGMNAEDIAARFGITAAVVKQRLKLGAVSPKLIKLYRKGELNLDQLSAFAITDDHAAQERVCEELSWNDSREAILHALSEGQVSSTDRRAQFVGAKAYEAAGGVIMRDLFDAEGGGFFTDAMLLNRLVREGLQSEAAKVLAEGWKWVSVEPEFDYARTASMRRVHPQPMPLSPENQAKADELARQYEALSGEDEQSEENDAEMERLTSEIEALNGAPQFRAGDKAIAGAFISLGGDGEPRIERGFVRALDHPHASTHADDEEAENAPETNKPLSEKLVAELTSYRTSALRNALAQNPDTALIAVAHVMAAAVFFPHDREASCLEVRPKHSFVSSHAPGIAESAAEQESAERHAAWEARMPEEPSGLWKFVAALDRVSLLDLLAHCAAQSLNAIRAPGMRSAETGAHADALAQAVGLDMSAHWQPSAANYLGRVSKEQIQQAVREGVSDEAAQRIGHLRKQDMAAAAERLLAGTGWLPLPLRLDLPALEPEEVTSS